MIYLFENDNNNASIVFDGATLTPIEKNKGIAAEKLPIQEQQEGKIAVLKCKKSTGEVWYEYEDIPPTLEDVQKELINTLGQELSSLKIQLIMGGII